jgi:hypothetical protein
MGFLLILFSTPLWNGLIPDSGLFTRNRHFKRKEIRKDLVHSDEFE